MRDTCQQEHEESAFGAESEADIATALLNEHATEYLLQPPDNDKVAQDTRTDRELRDVTSLEDDSTTVENTPEQASYRQKMIITLFIYWNFATLGMVYGQTGPVLPDLQSITGSSLQEITWLFTGFGIGYIAGCLLAGIAQEKLNTRLVLFVCTMASGITAGVLPWSKIIYISVGIKAVQGMALAGQDTVGIAMIFAIWKKDSGIYNQLIYIVYAAGCFLSPLYSKPFIRDDKVEQPVLSGNETTVVPSNVTSDVLYSTETNVHFAFLITAIASISAALPFLLMYILKVYDPAFKATVAQEEKKEVALPLKLIYVILTITFILSFVSISCIDMFPNLLTTFVLQQLAWTQQNASNLTAVYNAMYGVGNALGILVLKFSTTNTLIVLSYTGATVSLVGCMIGTLTEQNVVIWVTIVITGISVASIYATLFTWIEENVTHVTGRISAGILCFSAVGLMVDPILLGYLMEKQTPMWFLNFSLGGIVLCTILYTMSFLLVKRYSSKPDKTNYVL